MTNLTSKASGYFLTALMIILALVFYKEIPYLENIPKTVLAIILVFIIFIALLILLPFEWGLLFLLAVVSSFFVSGYQVHVFDKDTRVFTKDCDECMLQERTHGTD